VEENQNPNIPSPVSETPNPTPSVIPDSSTPVVLSAAKNLNQLSPKNPAGKFSLKLIIGIIIFLLVVGSAAGFYIYKQQSLKTAKPTPISQKQAPLPTEALEGGTDDPTANWRTYNGNTLYDKPFTIKYPNTGWVLEGNKIYPEPGNDKGFYIALGAGGHGGLDSKEDRIFPAGKAIYFWSGNNNDKFVGGYATFDINNSAYIFAVSLPNNEDNEKLFNQMLKTFKPTNSASVDTLNWKTYNSDNGYSFKYPNTLTTKGAGENGSISFSDPTKKYLSDPYFTVSNIFGKKDCIDEIAASELSFQKAKVIKDVTLNNVPAKQIQGYSLITLADGDQSLFREIAIVHKKTTSGEGCFTLDYATKSIKEEIPIFDQILSTFKFTDLNNEFSQEDLMQIKQLLAIREKVAIDKIINLTKDSTSNSSYASGGYGIENTGGAKWFAKKINSQWTIVNTGNGLPTCAEISKYDLPKDFLPCY